MDKILKKARAALSTFNSRKSGAAEKAAFLLYVVSAAVLSAFHANAEKKTAIRSSRKKTEHLSGRRGTISGDCHLDVDSLRFLCENKNAAGK